MVTRVTLNQPPGTVLAKVPSTFTCETSSSKPQACIRAYVKTSGAIREIDPIRCTGGPSNGPYTRRISIIPKAEDNGAVVYCNASNIVTDPPVQSPLYTLNVQYPPENDLILSGYTNNTTIEAGDTVTLTCDVGTGNPRPVLTWLSGCGPGVHGNAGSQGISINITVSPSLNQKSCVCKGTQGGALTGWSQQKGRTFHILFGPDSVQLGADPGQSGDKVRITENGTVTLICTSGESNPAAILLWYNNNAIVPAAELSKSTSEGGHNLGHVVAQRYTVRADQYQDGDIIRCEAQRSGQASVSSTVTLDIQYAPKVSCNTTDRVVFEGQRVRISCNVISKTQPQVTSWFRKGEVVIPTPTTFISTSPGVSVAMTTSIEVLSVDEGYSGRFLIKANNSIGSSQAEVNITVLGRESFPEELQVTSCVNNEVSLTWASGIDKSLIQHYLLEYRGTENVWNRQVITNPGGVKLVSKTLRHLQTGVLYHFRLQPELSQPLLEYATANCTVQDDADSGFSIGSAICVGVVIGMAIVTVTGIVTTYWLLRRGKVSWNKDATGACHTEESNRSTDQNGLYEDLRRRPTSGQHYEDLAIPMQPPSQSTQRIYENVTFNGLP